MGLIKIKDIRLIGFEIGFFENLSCIGFFVGFSLFG